jgi:hypothetical protein
MKNVTTAIAWDYLTNTTNLLSRLMMYFCGSIFLLQHIPSSPPTDKYSALGIDLGYKNLLFVAMWLVYYEWMGHSRITSLYRKPISTLSMVAHYYWGGMLLVACQLGILLGTWKLLFLPHMPIVWPFFYGIVFYSLFQPWLSGRSVKSLWIFLPVFMFVIYDRQLSRPINHWPNLSSMELVVGLIVIAMGFLLSLWRVSKDRSGRVNSLFANRSNKTWESLQELRMDSKHPIATPLQAYRSLDFRSRTIRLPIAVSTLLILGWIAAFVFAIANRSLESGLHIAFRVTAFAVSIQCVIAFIVGGLRPFCLPYIDPLKGWFTGTRLMNTLPISNQEIARGTLHSAGLAVTLSSTAIFLSYVLVGAFSGLTGSDQTANSYPPFQLAGFSVIEVFFTNSLSGEIIPSPDQGIAAYGSTLLTILVCMAISFIAIVSTFFLEPTFNTLKSFGVPVFLLFPISLIPPSRPAFKFLVAGMFIWLLAALLNFTSTRLRSGDLKPRSAITIWGTGVTVYLMATIAWTGTLGFERNLLLATLVVLTMLPFFAVPLAVRTYRAI